MKPYKDMDPDELYERARVLEMAFRRRVMDPKATATFDQVANTAAHAELAQRLMYKFRNRQPGR